MKKPKRSSPNTKSSTKSPKLSSGSGSKARATRMSTQRAGSSKASEQLAGVRDRISGLDKALVKLLNDRASLVVEVGKLKRAAGLPVYAPHREAEVLDRALKANTGPLPDRTLEAVYRELMSGSFQLQQPLRIGFLGPLGSYSHLAATRHFGSSVEFEDLHDIAGVFTEVVRGHVNYGLVPIENSTGGGIAETMDCFRDGKTRGAGGATIPGTASGRLDDINIVAEVQLAVHHSMLANGSPRAVKRIYSKPEVFQQCKVWLATQYPHVQLIPAPSSSKAAEMVAEQTRHAVEAGLEPDSAAIGSELAGQIFGLKVLFAKIEDRPDNITRFFAISRQHVPRTGDDKTSVMFNTADKPGALVQVLQEFEKANINLTHIEKRPSGSRNWTYTFFVDAQGHREDPGFATALDAARHHCRELVVLGSYPRSKRIL
jgi:chorismate mutase / prephenate dehydratase